MSRRFDGATEHVWFAVGTKQATILVILTLPVDLFSGHGSMTFHCVSGHCREHLVLIQQATICSSFLFQKNRLNKSFEHFGSRYRLLFTHLTPSEIVEQDLRPFGQLEVCPEAKRWSRTTPILEREFC